MTTTDPADISAAVENATAAAIREHAHSLGFHLGRIETQLGHIHDTLQRVADALSDLETKP